MTFNSKTIRFLIIYFIFTLLLFNSSNLKAISSQATIPLNITVHGKLIITDAENNNNPRTDSNLNLLPPPDLNNSTPTKTSGIRIRTNLSNWKITAHRSTLPTNSENLRNISLTFKTQVGSRGDLNAGRLVAPFNIPITLDKIPAGETVEILQGTSKTSISRDPKNEDNWFQLTTIYNKITGNKPPSTIPGTVSKHPKNPKSSPKNTSKGAPGKYSAEGKKIKDKKNSKNEYSYNTVITYGLISP